MKLSIRSLLILLFVLLGSITNQLSAQSLIHGKVTDESNREAIAWANVILITRNDSTYVTGTATDESGSFSIQSPSEAAYLVQISYLGYDTWTGDPAASGLDIRLSSSSNALSEVTVTASRQAFKMENGGISADVQNSMLKDMGTLPQVLGQLPFVVKNEDAYTILGKGAPIFYINNRLVRNQFDLQQINSKDIKKITVITNPGAEYDATVNAVIKIETIRSVGEGLSGSINSFSKYNKKWYTIDRIPLNYRKGNLDIFANIQYFNMSFPKDRNIERQIRTADGMRRILSETEENDKWKFWAPQAGFNYLIGNKHALGVKYEYANTFDKGGNSEGNVEVFNNGNPEEAMLSDRYYEATEIAHYINAYYAGEFAAWMKAKLDLDYKTTNSDRESNILNTEAGIEKEKVVTAEKGNYDLYAGKLTLTTPAWQGEFVYGLEGSYTKTKQDASVIEDTGIPGIFPNNNEIKQDLIAGFISYGKTIGKISGNIGFRYENIHSKYYQYNELIDEQSKDYSNFFPTARLSYTNDQIQMELAYRNSTSRPGYQQLRSTIHYMAPYTYYSGDPFLQPSYNNSLTYMTMWKNVTLMTSYNSYKDRIIIDFPEKYVDNSILTKPINVRKSQEFVISLNYSKAFGIWRPNWEMGMRKDFLEIGTPEIKYNDPLFSAGLRNAFQLKKWMLGLDINARTKGNRDGEYYSQNSWSTNIYVNRIFFDGALMVNLTGTDIFKTYNDKTKYYSNDIDTYWDNNMYRQSVILNISYRFNTARDRYKGSRSTDEFNRL